MKLALVGSSSLAESFLAVQSELGTKGHTTTVPASTKDNLDAQQGFHDIAGADAVLVLNFPKDGIDGYIGATTLMQLAIALHDHKPIYLLYPTPSPEEHRWAREVAALQPKVLNGDLSGIPGPTHG